MTPPPDHVRDELRTARGILATDDRGVADAGLSLEQQLDLAEIDRFTHRSTETRRIVTRSPKQVEQAFAGLARTLPARHVRSTSMHAPDLATSGEAGVDLEALAELLSQAGYTSEQVLRALAVDEPVEKLLANTGRYSFFYREELDELDTAVAVLAQLFMFGCRVRTERLEVVPEPLRAILEHKGFFTPIPDRRGLTRATVSITELQSRYFLSDRMFENAGDDGFIPSVHEGRRCMPPHASSIELLTALEETHGSFLDVGCGSGCISILTASRYKRIGGFDMQARAVDYARANARMNRVVADYAVSDHTEFRPAESYDHCAFNAVEAVAFDFVNSTVDRILAPGGVCQMWSTFSITRNEGSALGAMRARAPNHEQFHIEVTTLPDSPWACSRELFAKGRLPDNSLLVEHPDETAELIGSLKARGVVEIICCIFTIRRR
jgi:SAM-dependent methyltransferase